MSDLLTSVVNILGRSTLRASSCGNDRRAADTSRIGDKASIAAPRALNRLPTELKLLRSENMFVSFCLRAPGYGLTVMHAGSSSGGGCNTSASVTVTVTSVKFYKQPACTSTQVFKWNILALCHLTAEMLAYSFTCEIKAEFQS